MNASEYHNTKLSINLCQETLVTFPPTTTTTTHKLYRYTYLQYNGLN